MELQIRTKGMLGYTFTGRIRLDISWRLEISPGLDLEGGQETWPSKPTCRLRWYRINILGSRSGGKGTDDHGRMLKEIGGIGGNLVLSGKSCTKGERGRIGLVFVRALEEVGCPGTAHPKAVC